MRKKLLWILGALFCLLANHNASAQAPTWSVNVADYQYQMALVGVLNLDGIESTDTNDVLGAFINNEVRGVGRLVYLPDYNRYLVYMNIYHHEGSGTVHFKIYDASQNRVVDLEQTEAFEIQTLRGSTAAPITYSYPRLSSEANIFTFNLPGQDKSSINGSDILVTMPYGYDVKNIAATYSTSPLSKVYIGNQLQQSGTTVNNFSNPLYYKVIAADATTEKNYTVTVNYSAAPPQGIILSKTQLSESAPLGTVIANIQAIDPDGEGTFHYFLVNGQGDQDNAYFQIQGDQLLLRSKLDFEKQVFHSFRMKAVDESNNAVEAVLQIVALNENDEKPVPVARVIDIPENQPVSTLVHTMEVTDPDGQSNYTYRIYDGNIDGKFTIHEQKGEIRILKLLDYELEKRTYDLDVLVSDGINENHATITFRLQNVNDQTPTVAVQQISVSETAAVGSVSHQLQPQDADGPSTFSYRLIDNVSAPFEVSNTGAITIAAALDFETTKTYALKVGISDGQNEGLFTFPVQILNENDEAPIPMGKALSISEILAVGSLIHTVEATDPDGSTGFTYRITEGNSAGKFSIDPLKGELRVLQALDFEQVASYTLKVGVSDGVREAEAIFPVQIINENDEKPVPASATVEIPENQPVSTLVHTMVVTDPDGQSNFNYRIFDGNIEGKFAIHTQKGEIRILNPLDYELEKRTYTLDILVSDGINESRATVTFHVHNVNDQTPTVAVEPLTVSEAATLATIIHRLQPQDADGATNFTYRVIDNPPFSIDATGAISLASVLDYEQVKNYALKIGISDGVNEGTFTFPVQVQNENDESPVLTAKSITVSEKQPVAALVHTVEATDPDGPTAFTFRITEGNNDGKFSIDSQKGEIRLLEKLDFELVTSYTLKIGVSDGQREVMGTYLIQVLNENDEKPQPVSAVVEIPENQPVGTLLHTLAVTDPDGQSNFTFRISDGNLEGRFSLHEQKGEFRILKPLDFEKDNHLFELEVMVSDGVQENTATVVFQLQNINDVTPVVQEAALSIKESAAVGTLLHQLEPTDGDGATTFTYTIVDAANMPFSIDASGKLTLASALDFETVKKYNLKVEISDGANKATFAFPVQVINENDEKPVLAASTIEVLQTVEPGFLATQLEATDPDQDGSPITFSLLTQGVPFEVTGDGRLKTTQVLALSDQASYKLKIAISDQVNIAEYELTVNVLDEGDLEMEIANVLTPNGDGYNDYWEIKKGYLYQKYIFRVFDMRGQEVFFSKGYKENFWGGLFQGKLLPAGTYVYIVNSENNKKVFKGTLTILH